MSDADKYSFIFRGRLADEAIERTGLALSGSELEHEDIDELAATLSLSVLDDGDIQAARRMGIVYISITAFEKNARSFVKRVLIDEFDEGWWESGVSDKIRTFAESRRADEIKTKWHGDRGGDLLDYTEMGHLPKIIQQNFALFEPHIPRIDWATALFSTIEKSRNVIMHSGELSLEDIERVGINIRDWSRQVGT